VAYAAAPYRDAVRAALLAHKERGALGLAAPLGAALAGAVRGGGGEGREGVGVGPHEGPPRIAAHTMVSLIPIPSAPRSTRARGHDPVRRMALAAAGELRRRGVGARVLGALRQRRGVADQAGLSVPERWANLAGALEVAVGARRLLAGAGRIVLVDDLMTTGASLAEGVRALTAAGVDSTISAAVVAAPRESFERDGI
jgi:predicted amidophosphoribosyltransferase